MTGDDRSIINAIIEYIEDIGEPQSNWPRKDFEKASYSRWAADEIIMEILTHTDWTPMHSVENFKSRVGEYSCIASNNDEPSLIFRIAYETAVDISDIINAMMP